MFFLFKCSTDHLYIFCRLTLDEIRILDRDLQPVFLYNVGISVWHVVGRSGRCHFTKILSPIERTAFNFDFLHIHHSHWSLNVIKINDSGFCRLKQIPARLTFSDSHSPVKPDQIHACLFPGSDMLMRVILDKASGTWCEVSSLHSWTHHIMQSW